MRKTQKRSYKKRRKTVRGGADPINTVSSLNENMGPGQPGQPDIPPYVTKIGIFKPPKRTIPQLPQPGNTATKKSEVTPIKNKPKLNTRKNSQPGNAATNNPEGTPTKNQPPLIENENMIPGTTPIIPPVTENGSISKSNTINISQPGYTATKKSEVTPLQNSEDTNDTVTSNQQPAYIAKNSLAANNSLEKKKQKIKSQIKRIIKNIVIVPNEINSKTGDTALEGILKKIETLKGPFKSITNNTTFKNENILLQRELNNKPFLRRQTIVQNYNKYLQDVLIQISRVCQVYNDMNDRYFFKDELCKEITTQQKNLEDYLKEYTAIINKTKGNTQTKPENKQKQNEALRNYKQKIDNVKDIVIGMIVKIQNKKTKLLNLNNKLRDKYTINEINNFKKLFDELIKLQTDIENFWKNQQDRYIRLQITETTPGKNAMVKKIAIEDRLAELKEKQDQLTIKAKNTESQEKNNTQTTALSKIDLELKILELLSRSEQLKEEIQFTEKAKNRELDLSKKQELQQTINTKTTELSKINLKLKKLRLLFRLEELKEEIQFTEKAKNKELDLNKKQELQQTINTKTTALSKIDLELKILELLSRSEELKEEIQFTEKAKNRELDLNKKQELQQTINTKTTELSEINLELKK
jgi:hypothetical protein